MPLMLMLGLVLTCSPGMGAEPAISIPDVTLVNQDGAPVKLYSDLVAKNVVVVNFMFTTCTTICPPMGAAFGRLQRVLSERGLNGVRLISISVDPLNDTPEKLKAWAAQFDAGPHWTLLTGAKPDVVKALRAFSAYTPDKLAHSSLAMIGNAAKGEWIRANVLSSPEKLADLAAGLAQPPAGDDSAARRYFTDTVLVDQDGVDRRFYTDLILGKTVVINVMFTTCKDSCPIMAANFARLQDWLGPRLGKDAHMISISIDPENDTVPRVKAYAERFKAKPGWFFLSGRKSNVDLILKKLGLYVEQKETHLNVFLIGNDVTGLWKKALGVADSSKLIGILDSVLSDTPR